MAAADIRGAAYDPLNDELVVEIVYRGTNPDHDFRVEWGRCNGAGPAQRAVGRLIDEQGRDFAREEYRVQERLSLEALPCRPAMVTLRLGRIAHTNVFVPDPQAKGAKDAQ